MSDTVGRHWLFRWERLGGHVHVDVFAGTEQQTANQARPRLGRLVMDEADWESFQQVVGVRWTHAQNDVEFKER